MTAFVGNNGVIKVNGTPTVAGGTAGLANNPPGSNTGTVVAEVRSYSIDITSDTIETTTMTKDVRTYVKGMASWSGSADVYWDSAHWSIAGFNPAASTSTVGSSPFVLAIYPEGITDGTPVNAADKVMYGNIIITGYSVSSSMDGLIEATISFQGSGPFTYASSDVSAS